MSPAAGRLFVVSTPIGNMGDFSFRAVDILKSVAVILAEDTRHSRALLDRYDIATPMSSYHEHNEASRTAGIIRRLEAGEDVALISDAGTPLLSDPGARLVSAASDAGVTVVPVPGASALLAALVVSGLDATRFTFHGFLPRRGRDRAAWLDEIISSRHTSVLYEAPTRVADTLLELAERAPDRHAAVARELTKQFEEVRRGTVASLAAYYREGNPRGEIVVLVAGAPDAPPVSDDDLAARAARLLDSGLTVRDAVAELTRTGTSRNAAYRIVRSVDAARSGGNDDGR